MRVRPATCSTTNRTFLLFDIDEFGGASIGGEWLVPLGNFFEAGAGISYTGRRCRASTGTSRTLTERRSIRIWNCAWSRSPSPFRVLPLGQSSPFQPYFGAGLGVVNWRYREQGEFIDFDAGGEIFEDTFEASGSSIGPIVLGGIRFAGRRASAGGESSLSARRR